jgi:hypothetical protein
MGDPDCYHARRKPHSGTAAERMPQPMTVACHHLDEYLETNVRARESKAHTEKP